MAKPRSYSGTDIEITFDMSRCIHARNCFLKLPQVFDPARRPWVDPDAASADEIAAMVTTCPSGALTYRRQDGRSEEAVPILNRVQVLENGPIALAGDISIGEEKMVRATLCRCGASANKPFCDYAHVEDGFAATGEPPEKEGDPGTNEQGGTMEVAAIENGPLQVKGAAEIISGTGRRLNVTKTAYLCRCGKSQNKPYCDGSHKDAGFEAPGT